jgi:hypothetical protein
MRWFGQTNKRNAAPSDLSRDVCRGGRSRLPDLPWALRVFALVFASMLPAVADDADFEREIRPLLKQYCLDCHSIEKHKGDLDLESYNSLKEVLRHPTIWENVVEKVSLSEMPPKDKPQPTAEERKRFMDWVNRALDEAAAARAGDPGPVVLRRLSNAEYTYTLRDLTGVDSLNPALEFPVDSASGEGFMNVGNSLVMSPSLLIKYLDAAKEIANHAMLLPDGLAFSASTSQRDWSEEKLAAIRTFYGRFTENGGGTAVNLQGIKFDTKDGGVLPLERYLVATLSEREALRSGKTNLVDVARKRGLNVKYLAKLWAELNDSRPSLPLDQIRAQWRGSQPGEVGALVESIGQWQRALWRFTTVGHIGKRDGPKAWEVPVTPLVQAQELRFTVPQPTTGGVVRFYLATSDAGDGNEHDFAVWENARLVAPGRPDLPLRDVRAVTEAFNSSRERAFSSAAACLAAAAEVTGALDTNVVLNLARKHRLEAPVFNAWLNCLGIGPAEPRIDSYLTQRLEKVEAHDFVKGWVGEDALSVLANSSDQHVRVPGNVKPHGVVVHPSPKRRVVVGWRSPVAGKVRLEGMVQHAHPECGNGVTWSVELRRGNSRQLLSAGRAQGATEVKFGPLENLAMRPGDRLTLSVGPRDGDHSCDLTQLDLRLSDGTNTWDLAKEVAPDILAGNPHADSQGHAGIWHFYSESDSDRANETPLPVGSLLAKWQSVTSSEEKQFLAKEVERLLLNGAAGLALDSPDAVLYRQLASVQGPLLSPILQACVADSAQAFTQMGQSPPTSGVTTWGLDPALFGRHPNGSTFGPTSLCVQAPSIIEVRLPADLVEGCEFLATGSLHAETGAEGSVQLSVLPTRPAASGGLVPGVAKEQGGRTTWSDGERPVISDSPIIVCEGSAARRRLEIALEEFRQLFPAALCYTKIVPVDEVVTFTLFYREDQHLRRLMLDDSQAAELDRLWSELHYVSQDALRLVDAFEQLWQFATQDADPSAFTPMREPIKQRAEEFRKLLIESEPAHLAGILKFAGQAYRRPLTVDEGDELRGLYQRLRQEDIPHADAIRLTLARVLVAPAFLYRLEKSFPGEKPGPVSDWELATRLSYFLWSSSPDSELRDLAAKGQLSSPAVLAAQSRRMVRDPRIRRLATEFACAWLHIHDFAAFDEKSERHFPTFAALRGPMYEEAIQFFTDAFQNDASVLSYFLSDHTFLNQALAEHYGIPGVTGSNWQKIEGVQRYGRGGILGLGATLARQSGASRTSPILRGNWVAEVLLGDKIPRPPRDVPRLPEDEAAETLTVRELTAKHTADPRCAICHVRFDGYGFAMEGYDAIGRLRERDLGDRPIDTRAQVFDGTILEGADGLRDYLLTHRRDAVVNQFCRKLLGYSLGRAVILSDKPLLSKMQTQLRKNDYRFSAILETIIRSQQFREIRGKERVSEE